jgi:rhodanese-related sulfurtransferase
MKPSHRTLAAALLSLALVTGACGGTEATPTETAAPVTIEAGYHLVDASTAADVAGEAVVLDVRTPAEFADGHLAGAVNIDIQDPGFQSTISELDRHTTYLVYCRSGNRSKAATDYMRGLGFSTIYELDGGIVAWNAASLPLDR